MEPSWSLDASPAGFEQELASHRRTMFRFAASLVRLDQAEDLVQDALLRAWAKRGQFDPARGPLLPWLLAIVADQARSRWRRRREPMWMRVLVPEIAHPDAADHAADLHEAVAGLPARQRAAIVLHHWVDLPIVDVAEVMACSEGTVKSTLHDARRNLARALGESYARS